MSAISDCFGFKIAIFSLFLMFIYILKFCCAFQDTYSIEIQNISTNTDNYIVNHYMEQNGKHFNASVIVRLKKKISHQQHFADLPQKSTYKTTAYQQGPDNNLNDQNYVINQNFRKSKLTKASDISSKGEKNKVNKHFFLYNRNIKNIDCLGIFNNNDIAIYKALTINVTTMPKLKPAHYIKMTKNCTSFINDRGYITHHLTEEERNFPIAFSILMYKDVEQAERLLRAIYRPQNIYCIHVDSKTDETIYKAMSRIANCFQNVFLSNKRVNVTWGEISVLEPELLCMEQLWARNKKWKYFINLTGQEFPLKTNYELVQILKAYNGSNDVETTVVQFTDRCLPKNEITPPHEINVTKGAVHIAVTRGFVDYSLHDPRARDILDYVNTSCKIPDEAYFTILNHNRHLGVPGSYKGFPETTKMSDRRKPYLARFKNRYNSKIHRWICHGKWFKNICIFAIKDLPLLSTRKELLANKFHLDEQPVTYGCLEELIFNRTRDEYQGKRTFDTSWYSNLGFVLAESKVD